MIDYSVSERRETYRYEVLDSGGHYLGDLRSVMSCSLDWSIYNQIRGSGSLIVRSPGLVAWQQHRVRVWMDIETSAGAESWPLITAVCRVPSAALSTSVETSLELHDYTILLAEHLLYESFSVPAGATVTDRVAQILSDLGVPGATITDSTAVLSSPMVWDPSAQDNVSWLRVINDLLATINYRAIYPNGLGFLVVEPYTPPGARLPKWRLADDAAPHDRYVDGLTLDSKLFASYNDWVLVSRGTETEAAWTYHTTNDDPLHPYSTVSLGRTVTERRPDVDVASYALLAAEGERVKAEAMADQRTFGLSARWIPAVEGDVIDLVHTASGTATRAAVTARSLDCAPGALLGMTLREVS